MICYSILYKVYFPSGTKIVVDIRVYSNHDSFIDVDIYPSPNDVGMTSGLCGNLNGQADEGRGMSREQFYLQWK